MPSMHKAEQASPKRKTIKQEIQLILTVKVLVPLSMIVSAISSTAKVVMQKLVHVAMSMNDSTRWPKPVTNVLARPT
eukprot:2965732-Amphidinium_carterae.1